MEKKFKASKDKLKKAREEGQVAKSQDLIKLIGLVFVFELANLLFEPLLLLFNQLFLLPTSLLDEHFDVALQILVSKALVLSLAVCLGAMGLMVIVRVSASWMQTGLVFSTAPLKGGLAKMNPAKQLAQMFTLNKLWDLASALLKLSVIFGVGLLICRGLLDSLLAAPAVPEHLLWPFLNTLFLNFSRGILLALCLFAALDVLVQKKLHLRQMKMSDQEVKQERKNKEGDAQIKSKRRRLAQDLILAPVKAGIEAVKQADVVVVNPTHIAVALSYQPEKVPLPVVKYKAAEHEALETIAYAQEHSIPVIRYLWLARTLHADCQVGQTIPRETLQAAAELFKVIKHLKNDADSGHLREVIEMGS